MTDAQDDVRAALLAAARAMLSDAEDEAAGISMAATEAVDALDCGEALQALGVFADYEARMTALRSAADAARALLIRARDKGGA